MFVPGLDLSRRYYQDVVEPLLRKHFGELPHTAARVGSGSEVLGFDTARSADHEWGPRVQLFLQPADTARLALDISAMFSAELPKSFLGYPTHFDSDQIGRMRLTDGPVRHRIEVTSLDAWFHERVGFDPRGSITVADWLAAPTQRLLETTAGAVFHDGLGDFEAARAKLEWYPADVWRYVLACQWQRISQEEAFVGRCGEVGDELGSAVVAARLVRDLMRLCLLMARRYPPYDKWLGSAFARLPGDLGGDLAAALAATEWREREAHLARAYEVVGAHHNQLGLTARVDPSTRNYHDRPFQVLHAERFTAALVESITDPVVRGLPVVGAVDQFVDNTDVLAHPARSHAATSGVVTG
ncbi:DUF4037 domain-containing protein [Allokutzneria oryzae]|uniref:DUF4037 domain-containing protein n=1 Tax=Allokutzneria oryzae TaxID=1378989 RepID=A0ABV6A1H0_9PSEU